MADVTETYTLNFETNAQKATGLVGELEKTLSSMGNTGELSAKGLNSASRSILNIEKALGGSAGAVKKYSDSFSNLRQEVSEATKALQEAAQAYVVGGGTDVLGAAAGTMNLDEAKEVLAIRRAEGLTVEQVASEVVRAEKRKQDAIDETRRVMQVANRESAKAYQSAYTDPMSFLGQANSREGSTGLRASETSWAIQAKHQQNFRDELNRTEVAFQEQSRAAELAALRQQILARHTDDAGEAASRSSENYIALRYALYDVGRTALTASAAIAGTGVAALSAFGSQERAFTEVERIAEGSIEEVQYLRKELMDMSTEIPRSFQELSEIASLGGALGIDSTALDEFTNTVAKFVTLTGVTEEAATTGFGRISQYLGIVEEDYDKLGSAVLRAGNISVATEEQVLKFSSAIALPAARAGLLADEVVALGAATASFANINVEGAGSAFSRVFANIERSVAEGGESLDKFAAAAGYSSEQFKIAWGSEAGGTFNRILQGLSQNVDGLVGNLDELGIRNERDRRVVSALALNYQDYMRIVGESSSAWREGIYMNEAYGLVLDDLMSKWTIFTNALTNAAAAIGSSVAPAMKTLLDVATNTIVALTDFAQTPVGEVMFRMAATAGTLAAGITAVGGALAIAGASGLALRFALREVASSGLILSLSALRTAITNIGTASGTAAGLAVALGNAFRYVLRATIIGAALYAVSEAIFNTGDAAVAVGNIIIEFSNFLRDAGQMLNDFFGITAAATDDPTYKFFKGMGDGLKSWGQSIGSANKSVNDFSAGQLGLNDLLDEFNSEIPEATSGMDDYGDSAKNAADEVRTLKDYASDLAQVWSRAFEIRFSGQSTLDTITSSFNSIREAAADAAKRIRDMKNDMQSLQSDINIQEYFLSIAIEYGDTKRAAAIEADLAKKRAELADKTTELQKEQDKTNKSLVGNSAAAIDNRKQITDLVSQYQSHIEALAASGMSQDDLALATQRLKQDFINQATQLGFNRAELGKYASAFDDVAVAINKVPRNITVTANTNPAIQAFNEMRDAASRANNAVTGLRNNLGSYMPSGGVNTWPIRDAGLQAEAAALRKELANNLFAQPLVVGGLYKAANQLKSSRLSYLESLGYASGGFTGTGGMYEPAGIVHRGEFVFPKSEVNQSTGLPKEAALLSMMGSLPSRTVAPAGSAGFGGAQLTLSPGTIQALAQAVQPYLVIDGRLVAEASSSAYAKDNSVGAY